MAKSLKFQPVDKFYFNTHNSNLLTDTSSFSSFFPPRPNTVYGALRSALIGNRTTLADFKAGTHPKEVKEWIGTGEKNGRLAIDYLFLDERGTEYYPLPLDVQVLKAEKTVIPLELTSAEGTSASRFSWMLKSGQNGKSADASDYLISKEGFKRLVRGETPSSDSLRATNSFLTESERVGIAIGTKTRHVKNGMLYTKTQYTLNEDVSLNVRLGAAPDFDGIGLIQLGGGGNAWSVSSSGHDSIWSSTEETDLVRRIQDTGRLKLVLLGPAIWNGGSVPGGTEGDSLTLPNGLKVNIKTIATARPSWFGGWDMQRNRPKTRQKMVAAGTVILAEFEEADAGKLAEAVRGLHLTDSHAEEGFGFSIAVPY